MRPHQLMYSAALNEDDVQIIYRNKSSAKDDIESTKTAQYLKEMCFEVKRNAAPLPIVLTSQHFKEGQAPVPLKLIKFYLEMIATIPAKPTAKEKRLAHSMASDTLYNVTKGHVKPAKQLCFGVGMKSMTQCFSNRGAGDCYRGSRICQQIWI